MFVLVLKLHFGFPDIAAMAGNSHRMRHLAFQVACSDWRNLALPGKRLSPGQARVGGLGCVELLSHAASAYPGPGPGDSEAARLSSALPARLSVMVVLARSASESARAGSGCRPGFQNPGDNFPNQ